MELPKKIDLKVNETYTLKLRGWGTTGFFRSHEVIQTSQVVDVVRVAGDDNKNLEKPKPGEAEVVIYGASKDEVFEIRGLRPGHSMIQFFRHHAAKGSEREKEYLLEVNVKG